jgi:hypothetical protein
MTIGMRLISLRLKVSWVGSLRIPLKKGWSKRWSGISTIKNGVRMLQLATIKEKG